MSKQQMARRSMPRDTQYMLYLGLLISETQIAYYLTQLRPLGDIYIFSVFYFFITTAYFVKIVRQYLLNKQTRHMPQLEFMEYLGISLSMLLLSLNLTNKTPAVYLAIIASLFIIQCSLTFLKIMFFGSTTECLSTIIKTTRIFKLIKICIPIVLFSVSVDQVVYGFISMFLQIIFVIIIFKKATFQNIIPQVYFFTGVICGFLSSLEIIVVALLNISYCFIGQISFILCLLLGIFLSKYPLSPLFELKYQMLIKDKSLISKSDEDFIAVVLLIKYCIFDDQNSYQIPKNLKNILILETIEIVQKYDNENIELKKNESKQHLFEELINQKMVFFERFIMAVNHRLKSPNNMGCLQFIVNSFLSLKGRHIISALVIYYRYFEEHKTNMNWLEKINMLRLHSKISGQIEINTCHNHSQISFISFSQKLNTFREQLQQSFEKELKLIEYLEGGKQIKQQFPEEKILERNQNKNKLRRSIEQCTKFPIYIHSNQFKFMLLIFGIGLEKRSKAFELTLKKLYFSNDVVQNSLISIPNFMAIVSGFGRGQLMNCNEKFRDHFKISSDPNVKSTIYDIFPSTHQKNRHIQLMKESVSIQRQIRSNHQDYLCLLMVGKQQLGIKFRSIQQYRIDTRIYYEFKQGFNYACELRPENQYQRLYYITRKESELLEKKGLFIEPLSIKKQNQLDEQFQILTFQFEICEITQKQEKISKGIKRKDENLLEEKTLIIEKKLNQQQHKQYSLSNILELFLVFCLVLFIGASVLIVTKQISAFEQMVMRDSWSLKLSTLVSSKILLQSQILQIVNGTTSFPDSMCQAQGINSLSQYMINTMTNEIFNGYKPFFDILYSGKMSSDIIKYIYDENYKTNGIYWNSIIQKVTYVKMVQLVKANYYQPIRKKTYNQLNIYFLMNFYPVFYTDNNVDTLQYMYQPIKQSIFKQFQYFQQVTLFTRIVLCLVTFGVITILPAFRIWGNKSLVKYYDAIANLSEVMLTRRRKQIKNIITLLKRSNKEIPSVDINANFEVVVHEKQEKKQIVLSLKQLIKVEQSKMQEQQHETGNEQNDALLKKPYRKNIREFPTTSNWKRLLLYTRFYLFLMVIVLLGNVIFINLFLDYSKDKLKALQNFYTVSEQTSLIQQQYTNLIAHDWFKSLHYQSNMPMSPLSFDLYNNAIKDIQQSNIVKLIESSYDSKFALNILNGNVCRFFKNSTYCQQYRSGIFKNGFSSLLPTTLKEQQEINNFSTVYSDYFIHLCDQTKNFFEGIVPMTERIPMEGYAYSSSKINQRIPLLVVTLILSMLLLVAIPIFYQWRNYGKVKSIREQILSLDSIEVLYKEVNLKPYLNEVYYK